MENFSFSRVLLATVCALVFYVGFVVPIWTHLR